jgi:hypothetical protein
MNLQIPAPATEQEFSEFQKRAPHEVFLRVLRQRVIAEKLEQAAASAESEGKTREANEMREQAAQARQVAEDAIREHHRA